MSVTIKTAEEIDLMRYSCKLLAEMHDMLAEMVKPGISTAELDEAAAKFASDHGVKSNFYHYEGYPAHICTSVNEVVVHGIPSKKRILQEGDIISIDAGLDYKGWQSDAARTHEVGKVSAEVRLLNDVTKQCFFEGIKFAKAGNHLYDISAAIQKYAESYGFGVVRELVGHGIGRDMHEDPQIPNFVVFGQGRGLKLKPGMTLAIEPMITLGRYAVDMDDSDGWTVRTRDGSYASHYENTILITDGEPEILTIPR